MKIDKRLLTVIGNKIALPARIAGVRKTTESKPGKVDKLLLSLTPAQLKDMESQLSMLDISDAQKVRLVRQAIANGTFRVDSSAIADGLIEGARESVLKMPGKKK